MLKSNGILAIADAVPSPVPHFTGQAGIDQFSIRRAGGSRVKRAIDVTFAGFGLIVLAPLLLVCSAVIIGVSPGLPIFSQTRVGYQGSTFQIFKFRTMHHPKSVAEPTEQLDARRIFWFGSILRRCSIDELPQLFNVLRGEMSLVGPRPHMVRQKVAGVLFEDTLVHYVRRHQVIPGMTGWAQINGCRGPVTKHADIAKRVAFDLEYIDRWSHKLDCFILLKTVCFGFMGKSRF